MIEEYNRQRDLHLIKVQHNYTITGHINKELIDKILNIRAFINYVPKTKSK